MDNQPRLIGGITALLDLGLNPEALHFLKTSLIRRFALGCQQGLHSAEAAVKFQIRASQCGARINIGLARQIDAGEQQIAQFVSEAGSISLRILKLLGNLP